MQPARADVLHPVVDVRRDLGDLGDAVFREFEPGAFGFDECRVLLGECVLGLGHYAHEVLLGQRVQLDTNRESSL